jgi:hypothetical protein
MRLHKLLPLLLATGIAPAAFGSVYVSDFTGSDLGDPLPGIDGWSQSEANPTDDFSPLSWISNHAGDLAATVGTYYDVPANDPLYVSRTIGVPLAGSTLEMTFGIQDSTTAYPDRNNFYIQITDGSGLLATDLFSLVFTATDQDSDYDDPLDPTELATANTQWDMNVTSNGNSFTEFGGIIEDGSYNMFLAFTQDGADMDYSLTIQGPMNSYTTNGTLTGLGNETFSELRVGTTMGDGADWGDNFFAFRGIPEPGSMALVAFSALGLALRRRR